MQKLRQCPAVNFILFYGIIELAFLSAAKTLRPFLLFGAAENPAAVILALQYKNAFLMKEQNIQLGRFPFVWKVDIVQRFAISLDVVVGQRILRRVLAELALVLVMK
jgi:hypothetical protein